MSIDQFTQQSNNFFDQIVQTVWESLPLMSRDDLSVQQNVSPGKAVGSSFRVGAPLVHPVKEHEQMITDYSDLFGISITYKLGANDTHSRLYVKQSCFELRVHTAPGIRFEYDRRNTAAPAAHIHYHGTAGLLSPVLMRNFSGSKDRRRKGAQEYLHIPVGGRRFRPSLEDFLYFVIKECGFVGREGWEKKLLARRELWLNAQCVAAVRDSPEVAATALKQLGYEVICPPQTPSPTDNSHPVW